MSFLTNQLLLARFGILGKESQFFSDLGDGFGHLSQYDKRLDESKNSIKKAKVIYANVFEGVYLVRMENPDIMHFCIDLNGAGNNLAGRVARVYSPGSVVLVWWDLNVLKPGLIIGAEPVLIDSNFNLGIQNLNAFFYGRVGAQKNLLAQTISKSHTMPYHGDGQPADLSALGDFSVSNLFGGLMHLNLFQMILRMNDDCGIWMNFLDGLQRQVARTYQLWTPAGTVEKYSNGGESYDYTGTALFSWESLGLLQKPNGLSAWCDIKPDRQFDTRTLDNAATVKNKNVKPFFRFEEYKGWFGQGGLLGVKVPPAADKNDLSQTLPASQVFQRQITATGSYIVQASRLVAIERSVNIPCFRKTREPWNADGDAGDKNFTPGVGEKDKTGPLKTPASHVSQSILQQLNNDDVVAREQYAGLYAFLQHKKNYERTDRPTGNGKLDYAALRTKQFIPDLQKLILRSGLAGEQVAYTVRKTGMYFTEDGGIVLKDAYGNEIRTGANGIEIFSASDVSVFPQRRFVMMSGDDAVLTANKSVDITAAGNDIRLAANKNLETVSGLSGVGRMLLENKSQNNAFDVYTQAKGEDINTSGIVIAAKKSSLVTYADSIFTKGERAYHDYRSLWMYASQQCEVKSQNRISLLIGSQKVENNVAGGLDIKRNAATLLGDINVRGNSMVRGSLFSGNGIGTSGGILASGVIGSASTISCASGCVPQPNPGMAATIAAAHTPKTMQFTTPEFAEVPLRDPANTEVKELYDQKKVGHNTTERITTFSFRTTPQYGTTEYVFFAPAYRQESNVVNTSLLTQMFNATADDGPFPGKTCWTNKSAYVSAQSIYAGIEPYDIENQNNTDTLKTPKLNSPQNAMSAIIANQ